MRVCLGLAALLMLAGPTAADQIPALPAALLPFGGPFALVDHHGDPRTEEDFAGRFMLIQFGYTFCPDVCPLGLATMHQALDLLGDAAAKVQPLFVTVDPERDTPAQLAAYVEHFHPALIGLTGSEAQIRDAARAYKVHRRKVVPADGGDYLVDHGSITYLMGPDGSFVTLFPYATKPDFMAAAIANYLD